MKHHRLQHRDKAFGEAGDRLLGAAERGQQLHQDAPLHDDVRHVDVAGRHPENVSERDQPLAEHLGQLHGDVGVLLGRRRAALILDRHLHVEGAGLAEVALEAANIEVGAVANVDDFLLSGRRIDELDLALLHHADHVGQFGQVADAFEVEADALVVGDPARDRSNGLDEGDHAAEEHGAVRAGVRLVDQADQGLLDLVGGRVLEWVGRIALAAQRREQQNVVFATGLEGFREGVLEYRLIAFGADIGRAARLGERVPERIGGHAAGFSGAGRPGIVAVLVGCVLRSPNLAPGKALIAEIIATGCGCRPVAHRVEFVRVLAAALLRQVPGQADGARHDPERIAGAGQSKDVGEGRGGQFEATQGQQHAGRDRPHLRDLGRAPQPRTRVENVVAARALVFVPWPVGIGNAPHAQRWRGAGTEAGGVLNSSSTDGAGDGGGDVSGDGATGAVRKAGRAPVPYGSDRSAAVRIAVWRYSE